MFLFQGYVLNMNIKPLHDNVIIKAVSEKEEVTKSGIVIAGTENKDKPGQGTVVAVGLGKVLDNGTKKEMSVKVGDQVMFRKYSPDEIKIEGEEYLVINESDILVIL